MNKNNLNCPPDWDARLSEKRKNYTRRVWSRRAILAAGWTVPAVTVFALNEKAQAQISIVNLSGEYTVEEARLACGQRLITTDVIILNDGNYYRCNGVTGTLNQVTITSDN